MEQTLVIQKKKRFGFSQGIGITLLIAIREIFSRASILNIMGQLVIAILIGMVWRRNWSSSRCDSRNELCE